MTSARTALAKQFSDTFGAAAFARVGLHAIRVERSPNRIVQGGVNFRRRSGEERMRSGNDHRVGEVIAVRNNSAAGPAADDFPFVRLTGDFRVKAEITKRERRLSPAIEAKYRSRGVREKRFVHRHVQRRGLWFAIVVDVQRIEHGRRLPRQIFHHALHRGFWIGGAGDRAADHQIVRSRIDGLARRGKTLSDRRGPIRPAGFPE